MSEIKFTTEKGGGSNKSKASAAIAVAIIVVAVIVLFNCFTMVREGYMGVKYRFGRIVGDNLSAGLNFHAPFAEEIKQIDTREQTYTFDGDAYTMDTQSVQQLRLKVNYRYIKVQLPALIRDIGIEFVEQKLLVPNVQKIAKDAIGKIKAEDLVQSRSKVQQDIMAELYETLLPSGVEVTSFAIENIAFDAAFEASIQAKVIAAQDALKMQNKTLEKNEEAKQVVIAAQANADSALIEAEAQAKAIELIQAQIANSPLYIEYLKIINWNGVLPQVIGEGVNPFMVLGETENTSTAPASATAAP